MCILFIGVNQHKHFPLIIAANRDEYHARPTQGSQFLTQHPSVLAGKDIKAGGSWMGVSKSGRLAALTNIRAPQREKAEAVSRGELVMDYLCENEDEQQYLTRLKQSANNYNRAMS